MTANNSMLQLLKWNLLTKLLSGWLITIVLSSLVVRLWTAYIDSDWQNYRHNALLHKIDFIQQQFIQRERISFQVLEELLQQKFIAEMTYWSGIESRSSIFKQLLALRFPAKKHQRGLAVYDLHKKCIAWRGWVFNLPPHWMAECLNGARFSTIAYSEERVYTALCTFVPIPHAKIREYVGVAVAFLPLDTNYPLSTRYIKSQSFAQEMMREAHLQDVKIHFDYHLNSRAEKQHLLNQDSLRAPLQNLNGDRLGWIIATSFPKQIILKQLAGYASSIQKISTAFLLLVLITALLVAVPKISFPGIRLFSIGLLWLVRYVILLIELPLPIPTIFQAPDVFYWYGSLGELILTAFTVLVTSWIFFYWRLAWNRIQSNYFGYLLRIITTLLLFALMIISYRTLCVLLASIVEHSGFQLFSFVNLLPCIKALSVYFATLLLGIALVLFHAWLLINLSVLLKIPRWMICIGSIILLFIGEYVLTQTNLWLSLFSIANFCSAAWLYPGNFPGKYKLRSILLLGLVCVAMYPNLYQANRKKIRAMVEYRAEEYQQNFVRDTLEESLDIFESDKRLLLAMKEFTEFKTLIRNRGNPNIALLLWANSPLLAEELDNVALLIYAKIDARQLQRQNYDPQKIWRPEDEHCYYLAYDFSLNMPIAQWYRPLIAQLKAGQRQILRNVPDFSYKTYNAFFYVAGTPIYEADKEIGFVVILTRHPKMIQPLSLPEIFSKRPAWENVPMVMGYFEGSTMLDTNEPYLAKDIKLSSKLVQTVEKQQRQIWLEQWREGKKYDTLYFPLTIKIHITPHEVRSQQQSIKRIAMIGYPLPSLLARIFYFLQFFLSGIVLLLLPLWLYRSLSFFSAYNANWWQTLHFPYEQKILMAFLLISGIPVLVMGFLSKEKAVLQIHKSYERNLQEYLENAEKALREERFLPFTPEGVTSLMPDNVFCRHWGQKNRRILNVYLAHMLCATNRSELFQTELLPQRIPGKAFYNLMLRKRDIYIDLESLANYTFFVGYKALTSPQDKSQIIGALAIPMIYKQADVQREVAEMIATIFTFYVVVFIIVVISGILLAHQITRPLAKLIQGTHRVSAGELDFELVVRSRDEFGELVNSFNRMTKDLKISREKLIQAEKDAAWREMARQIAHEIKNPLTPMKLSAQHISRAHRDKSEKFAQILEKGIATIIDAIDSLSRTASSFSEFAKFTKPTLAAQSLYPILQECLDLFASYQQRHITLTADIEENLPQIRTDPHQLKRVIINVLTNAVQAIEDSKGIIELVCYQDISEENITITIHDNGCGIDDSIIPRLFEPNFSTKSHGSGLGLAICKRAIDKMGGDIFIRSKQHAGTTVFIKVPLAE